MFCFGKKRIYSLGEKEKYFQNIINNPNISDKRKNWANLRLNQIQHKKNNLKLGDVVIVNDMHVGSPDYKPRVAVVAKTKNNKITVIPVRKDKKIMILKNFDGDRCISINNAKKISKNICYELRGFKMKNCNLTTKEKEKLKSKVDKFL